MTISQVNLLYQLPHVFIFIFCGPDYVGHSFVYVAHLIFLMVVYLCSQMKSEVPYPVPPLKKVSNDNWGKPSYETELSREQPSRVEHITFFSVFATFWVVEHFALANPEKHFPKYK